MRTEPAAIAGLVQAVLTLAVAFGFDLTPEQIGSILAVTAALLALLVRSTVSSPATTDALEQRAVEAEQAALVAQAQLEQDGE